MDIHPAPLPDSPVQSATHAAPAGAPESPVQGDLSQAVVTRSTAYADGHHIAPHWHSRAQFVFAVAGTMRVRTPRRAWIVPPSRALWVPARTVHEIEMHGVVEMRSLYLDAAAGLRTEGQQRQGCNARQKNGQQSLLCAHCRLSSNV